jgi:hypothetical protein
MSSRSRSLLEEGPERSGGGLTRASQGACPNGGLSLSVFSFSPSKDTLPRDGTVKFPITTRDNDGESRLELEVTTFGAGKGIEGSSPVWGSRCGWEGYLVAHGSRSRDGRKDPQGTVKFQSYLPRAPVRRCWSLPSLLLRRQQRLPRRFPWFNLVPAPEGRTRPPLEVPWLGRDPTSHSAANTRVPTTVSNKGS